MYNTRIYSETNQNLVAARDNRRNPGRVDFFVIS